MPGAGTFNVIFLIFVLVIPLSDVIWGQSPQANADFKKIVERKLNKHGLRLKDVCPIDTDISAKRILSDYGAIFLAESENPPPAKCIFGSKAEVESYQQVLKTATQNIGGTNVTLQKNAMESFLSARKEVLKKGLNMTPRGGATASKRTFDETVGLWNSRFWPGLDHWVMRGKISKRDADAARRSPIPEQIKRVLEWEQLGLYFSKDLSKSILYSVAAPGASQHLSMLALDIEQYPNADVRRVLAKHGWFQTVKSDLPHFTYLGVTEDMLPSLGLKPMYVGSQKFWIPNF